MFLRPISRIALALLLAVMPVFAFGRGPEPAVRIRLEDLGYIAPPNRAMLTGDSVATVHFVDDTHLLLTYSTHSLLSRLPDDPPNDQDRNVAALLVELPSGKVLARTEWRTHDHDQYLWPMRHGLFLLRIRNQLYTLDPVASLNAGHNAFERTPFLRSEGSIGFVSLSPAADLLILQTFAPGDLSDPTEGGSLGDIAVERREVQINFYRLHRSLTALDAGRLTSPVTASAAGVLRASGLVVLPVTSEGYLEPVQESSNAWDFDFYSHSGKKRELAGFDSSCSPRPVFVSAAEFISFDCHGGDHPSLDGFNMSGEHLWTKALSNGMRHLGVVTAPEAGRYAVSRLLFAGNPVDVANLVPEQFSTQEVTVTQTETGQDVFRIALTPMQRTGQNFDLSADGLSMAVLREGNIEVYRLPALSSKDREAIAVAARSAPEPTEAMIHLDGHSVRPPVPKAGVVTLNPDKLPTLAPMPDVAQPESTPARPKPTLYSPGEAPEK